MRMLALGPDWLDAGDRVLLILLVESARMWEGPCLSALQRQNI